MKGNVIQFYTITNMDGWEIPLLSLIVAHIDILVRYQKLFRYMVLARFISVKIFAERLTK